MPEQNSAPLVRFRVWVVLKCRRAPVHYSSDRRGWLASHDIVLSSSVKSSRIFRMALPSIANRFIAAGRSSSQSSLSSVASTNSQRILLRAPAILVGAEILDGFAFTTLNTNYDEPALTRHYPRVRDCLSRRSSFHRLGPEAISAGNRISPLALSLHLRAYRSRLPCLFVFP